MLSRPQELLFKFICDTVILYDLVDDELDQLVQCHRHRGQHQSRPRFMQTETVKEGRRPIRQGKEEGA